MARNRSSRSAERPCALVHVAAVAVALVSYLLLPVAHAGHHVLERGSVQRLAADGAAKSHGCHGCAGERKNPVEDPEPSEKRHDHSSCEICQALHAARKNIDLPEPAVRVIASPEGLEAVPVSPRGIPGEARLLPRSSRGPPRYI